MSHKTICMMRKRIFRILSKEPYWSHLTSSQQRLFLQNAQIRSYRKGRLIHSGSSQCKGLMLVRAGGLRTYMTSPEGRRVTLFRVRANERCILSASCLLDALTFTVSIQATEDTEVLLLPAPIFRQVAQENIYVKAFAYERVAHIFSDVMWVMHQILFVGVDKRLATFLLDEMHRTGITRIRATKEELAQSLGSAREVVNRLLSYWAKEGIVRLFRGGVKICDVCSLREITTSNRMKSQK